MARSIPGLSESLISMIMRTRGVTREQAIEIIGMSPDSDTASLADGLTGAPQNDITPEPIAGEPNESLYPPNGTQSGMMPTPAEIAALGGIGMPGSAANQQAAQQNAANDERYYDDVARRNDATLRPGMSARDRVKQATANVDAAEFGPMDGSKPPAEAFLPASKSKAPPPPSRQARPSYTPLAPPEVMTQADIDYVNSLPQNSPEAMARKRKRWAESDDDMADFESRLRSATGADATEAELESLRNGGIPPSFDPGSLGDDERLPSVSSARPQSYSNPNTFDPMAQADPRQSFRDFERAEDMRRRSQGVPVEAQRERDFASGQYGDFDQRLQDQSRWAKSMQIDPEGRGIGPNDFQRRYNPKESREWYEQNVVPRIREQARTSKLTGETYNSAEEKLAAEQAFKAKDPKYKERADLVKMRVRATMDAKSLGMTYEQVINEFDEYAALRGKQSTRDKRFAQRRLNNLNERDAEQALRRERLATRGLYGLSQAQANAYVALGDPNLSDEQRLAAEYTLNPRKFMVDYATAQNPPKGDGAGFDPVTDNALKQQYAAGYKSGTELAKSRMSGNRNWDGTNKVPKNAREWEDWRQQALEGLAINSAEYDGAVRWFENNFGAQPPGDREEPEQSGVPTSGARQGGRRGGR